jgi:hypothetical protein
VGFIVERDPERLAGLALPNFEDPARLLTPENLCATNVTAWWKMPLPAGFGWFHPGWYPRCVALGGAVRFPPPDDREDFPEVRLGAVTRGRSKQLAELDPDAGAAVEHRLAQGAAPGLALPFLAGDERVLVRGFTREGELRFDLPGERPEVAITLGGRALPVEVVLHTLWIDADAQRFVLVWSARGHVEREVAGSAGGAGGAGDEERDPLEGVEARVDGVPVYPQG